MGTWNTRLFCNDTTCDVRDTYMTLLELYESDEDVYLKTCEEYQELMGTDEEPLFWYALAETQWKVGRLMPEVRERALELLENDTIASDFEMSVAAAAKWKNTLQMVKEKINSPMPPRKKIRKLEEFERNPWNVGDVYAYQLNTNSALESGLLGKYVLIQKIGNKQCKDRYLGTFYLSVVRIFDKMFDSMPTLDELNGVRVLPFTPPLEEKYLEEVSQQQNVKGRLNATVHIDKKSEYPKRHLTFVGNVELPEVEIHWKEALGFTWWKKKELEHNIVSFYKAWRNVEY